MTSFEAFDPNAGSKSAPAWATFVQYRTPQFKTYAKRGPALLSFGHGSILYRMGSDGRWVEVFRLEPFNGVNTLTCDFCGMSAQQWRAQREFDGKYVPYDILKFKWADKATNSPRYAPFCPTCIGHVR